MTAPSTPQQGPTRFLKAIQTGLTYDMDSLSPISQSHARQGLCDSKQSMIRCYEREDDFHFELQERIRVTIPEDGAPFCSACGDESGRACRHIWWVDDQILGTAVGEQGRHRVKLQVSRDGSAAKCNDKTLEFHDWLDGTGLSRLCQLRGWWEEDPRDKGDVMLVEQTATSILSAFEPMGLLSRQHGQDNLEMLQRESQALYAKYRTEMIEQAKSQPFLLVAFGAAVPQAERDLLHLTKLHSRIERVYFDYQLWVRDRQPAYSNLEATAQALRDEVGQLRSFILEHDGRNMAIPFQVRVADILLYTLEQALAHEGDVEASATVSTPQYSGLSLRDRNLLHNLIDPNCQGAFVLDVLQLLGGEVLHAEIVQERVAGIADQFRDTSVPEEYVRMLERVVGIVE